MRKKEILKNTATFGNMHYFIIMYFFFFKLCILFLFMFTFLVLPFMNYYCIFVSTTNFVFNLKHTFFSFCIYSFLDFNSASAGGYIILNNICIGTSEI